MTHRSPLAPRWIAIALSLCIGIGVAGIWRRSSDPVFAVTARSALLTSGGAGEVLSDLAGARSPATWPAAWRGK